MGHTSGPSVSGKQLEGDRMDAIRRMCEYYLGSGLFQKLYAYMKERNRLVMDNERVDESVFQAELRERLGDDRMQYGKMDSP